MEAKTKVSRGVAICAAIALAALCLAIVATMAARQADAVFIAPEHDAAAVTGTVPDEATAHGYAELPDDGSLPFGAGLCGEPAVSEGGLDVWFANPEGNGAWLALRVKDESGNELGRTGIVMPGEYVRTVEGDFAGKKNIIFEIIGYEPWTYCSMGNITMRVSP